MSSFLVPLTIPPLPFSPLPASMRMFLHLPAPSQLLALAIHYTGASSLHRTMGLSSHWYPTNPSSFTYAAGAMGPSMSILRLAV